MLKNTTYITAGLCSLLLPIVSFGATIAGDSSVAGLGFDIFVTDVPANTELELLVLPPYGSEVKQTFVSNDAGEAGIAVAPLHTNSAGIYKIFIEEQPGVNELSGYYRNELRKKYENIYRRTTWC